MSEIKIQRSDLEKIYDCLQLNYRFHLHRDEMNAAVHQGEHCRFSPLTSTTGAERDRLRLILENENLNSREEGTKDGN